MKALEMEWDGDLMLPDDQAALIGILQTPGVGRRA